jgi:hypothetical protein
MGKDSLDRECRVAALAEDTLPEAMRLVTQGGEAVMLQVIPAAVSLQVIPAVVAASLLRVATLLVTFPDPTDQCTAATAAV